MIKCQPIVESQTIVRNWRWLVMITGFYDTTLDLPGVIVEEAHVPIGNAIDLQAFTGLVAIAEQQPPAYNLLLPSQNRVPGEIYEQAGETALLNQVKGV